MAGYNHNKIAGPPLLEGIRWSLPSVFLEAKTIKTGNSACFTSS